MQALQGDRRKIHMPLLRIFRTELTKMATAIITIKLMMDSPETDLKAVEEKAKEAIKENGGEFYKTEVEEVAFGLKALNLVFTCNEQLGSDLFEDKLGQVEGVSNAQCTDFRRTIG